MPSWEDKVVFANLYQAIRDQCAASGVHHVPTKETVIDELTTISMSRLQKPLAWADERCTLLTWQKYGASPLPTWENQNKHAMCRVLDMGILPWFKPDPAALPARKQLARSESFGGFNESSSSLPESQPEPEDTRAVASGASARRKRLSIVEITKLADEEDALDGFEAEVCKVRKLGDDENGDDGLVSCSEGEGESDMNSEDRRMVNQFMGLEASECDEDDD
jgi:hypothetical protein